MPGSARAFDDLVSSIEQSPPNKLNDSVLNLVTDLFRRSETFVAQRLDDPDSTRLRAVSDVAMQACLLLQGTPQSFLPAWSRLTDQHEPHRPR